MTKKTSLKAEMPLDALVQQTLRDAVVLVGKQIKSGDLVATNIQALVSLERRLRATTLAIDDAIVIEYARKKTPKERMTLVRELELLDSKRSGLA